MSLSDIKSRIEIAAKNAGRNPSTIKLIAVSKVQPNERVEHVLTHGHRLFGENKVQEAAGKWPEFRERFSDVEVHLIGPLQTNKVNQASELFDAIHSLDRSKLARKLADTFSKSGRNLPLFIQVNTGEEEQKSGVLPHKTDTFIQECRDMDLDIRGLMCIPPVDEEASLHFALLRKLAHENGLDQLSMGMSSDFEKAIAFGATHIRVGSAIFGERDYSAKAL